MKQVWRIITPTVALFLAIATFVGCGGSGVKTVKVDGKLMKGKEPHTQGDAEKVNLAFVSKDSKESKSYPAVVNKDGTFTVTGGMPPGKYKMTINLTLEGNSPEILSKQSTLNK